MKKILCLSVALAFLGLAIGCKSSTPPPEASKYANQTGQSTEGLPKPPPLPPPPK